MIIRIFIFFIAFNSALNAVHGAVIPGLFNSGVDDYYNILAENETDHHYKLILSPDNLFPGPETKVVISQIYPMNVWIQNNEYSKWIAPRADAGMSNNPGVYVYRITFDLSEFKSNTAEVSGLWSTDDNGMDILINGKKTGNFTPFSAFYGMYPFIISDGFKDGINSIDFVVNNVVSSSGLRVEIKGEADLREFVMK